MGTQSELKDTILIKSWPPVVIYTGEFIIDSQGHFPIDLVAIMDEKRVPKNIAGGWGITDE